MMKLIFLSLLILIGLACSTTKSTVDIKPPTISDIGSANINTKAKNIIFLIGDGMGTVQITSAMYLNDNYTSLERFPIVGLHKTHSADNLITDSAAGATAFSTGHKTFNGAIAVDQDTMPIFTILEEAEQKGKATGLVATCSITHATPASYIAHNKSRKNNNEIAHNFLDTDIDLFIGGGMKYFNDESDLRDLSKELEKKLYVTDNYKTHDISQINPNPANPYIYFTADKHPEKASEGRTYLKEASVKSLNFLKQRSDEGFFVMIEGSQIDWGGHANDADYIIQEMNDFELTIAAVLDWAEKDGETLVVVTADHETGGFAINAGQMSDTLETAFTTGHHTAVMIPVFAYGPGAEQFSGIYENTEIYHKMRTVFGW